MNEEVDARPFNYINEQPPELIWSALSEELPHSQVLTVIINYLSKPLKEEILGRLSLEIGVDVINRLKLFKRISPDVLREIERVLERKISLKKQEILNG